MFTIFTFTSFKVSSYNIVSARIKEGRTDPLYHMNTHNNLHSSSYLKLLYVRHGSLDVPISQPIWVLQIFSNPLRYGTSKSYLAEVISTDRVHLHHMSHWPHTHASYPLWYWLKGFSISFNNYLFISLL